MAIFEIISMLFPLFMILLFLIIFIKKNLRKGSPEEIKAAKTSGTGIEESGNQPEPAAFEKKLKAKLIHFPDIANPPKPAQPAHESKAMKTESTPSAEPEGSLNILRNGQASSEQNKKSEEVSSSDYYNRISESTGPISTEVGRPGSIDKLPKLKKAVIWSEILGKPKGLE